MAARKLTPCQRCGAPTHGVNCPKCHSNRRTTPIEQLALMAEHNDPQRAAHRLTAWTAQARRIWREMGEPA